MKFRRGDRVDQMTTMQSGETELNQTPGTIKRVKIEEGERFYAVKWDDGYDDEGMMYKDDELAALEEKE